MNTEIKNAIQAADSEAQYDESAKRLLAQKYVLAHILVGTVEEFQGMEIEKVVSLIEGDPYIQQNTGCIRTDQQGQECGGEKDCRTKYRSRRKK